MNRVERTNQEFLDAQKVLKECKDKDELMFAMMSCIFGMMTTIACSVAIIADKTMEVNDDISET